MPEGFWETLATSGWGWHAETGLHSLRLVANGVFDRFPKLQIIIGHMGENLPFSLIRSQKQLSGSTKYLQRNVSEYFQTNFHLTTSGYFTLSPLQCALMVFGVDRILFAVDYPYSLLSFSSICFHLPLNRFEACFHMYQRKRVSVAVKDNCIVFYFIPSCIFDNKIVSNAGRKWI